MTESLHNEEINRKSEHAPLDLGEVEVFYEDGQSFIVLETAKSRQNVISLPTGKYDFEELILGDGTTLTPADILPYQNIVDFAQGFCAENGIGGKAILHTTGYTEDIKFLEIVEPLVIKDGGGTLEGLDKVYLDIIDVELGRVPESRLQFHEIKHNASYPRLWVRLEAVYNPDKELVGRVIMAQLADLMADIDTGAIEPLIYSVEQKGVVIIPEQLALHDIWLYAEISVDDIENI